MKSYKEIFIKLKLYFERGRGYLSILSFSGTAFIVVSQLKMMGVEVDLTNYTAIAVICVAMLTMLMGFLEVRMRFFSKDLEVRGMKNPLWHRLYAQLDRIENRLDKLEGSEKK